MESSGLLHATEASILDEQVKKKDSFEMKVYKQTIFQFQSCK